MKSCPENFRPGCDCSSWALEPNEACYIHGWPDPRRCPYCGQFRGSKPCKRCGCHYGLKLQPGENHERANR